VSRSMRCDRTEVGTFTKDCARITAPNQTTNHG
jgi:hypothetical protein